MKVILTRNVGVRGEAYAAGTHLVLADEDAKNLIRMGKAQAEPATDVEEAPDQDAGKKSDQKKKPEGK